jgi:hypothetical protein
MRDAQSSLGKGSDITVMPEVNKNLFILAQFSLNFGQIWQKFGSKKL